MSKKDEINQFYDRSNKIKNITDILFVLNIVFSIISLLVNETFADFFIIFQILISVIYVLLLVIDDNYFLYNAESLRRKSAFENAFDIDLTNLETIEYYNNKQRNTVMKYIANIFESIYFSKTIAKKMLKGKIIKGFAVICIFILLLIKVSRTEILLIITQLLFSSAALVEVINLICYTIRLSNLYEFLYSNLITIGIATKNQLISVICNVLEYENIKSYYKVRLSTDIFNRINDETSKEWEKIEEKIRIM